MNTRKTLLTLLSLVLLLGLFSAGAAAQEEDGNDNQNPVAAYLAGLTGMTYEEVVALQQDGNGLGNIGRAYVFSEATGIPLEEALAQAKEVGWGNLFKDAGLHPGGKGLGSLIGKGKGHDKEPGPPPWAGGPKNKGDE